MEASGKGKSRSRDEVNFSFAAVLQLELRQKKCRTQDVMDQAIGSDEISEQIFMAAIRRVSILQIAVERIDLRPRTKQGMSRMDPRRAWQSPCRNTPSQRL
jgi:hypothetical protein